jgi:hypothetical protein
MCGLKQWQTDMAILTTYQSRQIVASPVRSNKMYKRTAAPQTAWRTSKPKPKIQTPASQPAAGIANEIGKTKEVKSKELRQLESLIDSLHTGIPSKHAGLEGCFCLGNLETHPG